MKKPYLYKRLSKYRVSKMITDIPLSDRDNIIALLKKRQYVQFIEENIECFKKGFVIVRLFNSSIEIKHDVGNNNGVNYPFDINAINEFLMYFENVNFKYLQD